VIHDHSQSIFNFFLKYSLVRSSPSDRYADIEEGDHESSFVASEQVTNDSWSDGGVTGLSCPN